MDFKSLIRDVPDFPKKGILFKDITTLWKDGPAFAETVRLISEEFKGKKIDTVMGVEARGFIAGAPVAYALGAGFIPVRKPGKLPSKTLKEVYSLEYGEDAVEVHVDAVRKGDNILIVDDLLATGGTACAMTKLVGKLGGHVAGIAFLVELEFLNGRSKLPGYDIYSIIKY